MAVLPDVTDPRELHDSTLLEQSLSQPDRFAALYDRHFQEIYRYVASRLGNQIADDLAAETFLVAFGKRAVFDPAKGQVRPWLYGIATKLVAQHHRAEERRLRAFRRTPVDSSAADGYEDLVVTRVLADGVRRQLSSAMRRLSDGDRDVLVLVAVAQLSHDEVAQALDIPFGTVGSRLNRVRRKLRVDLGGVNPLLGGSDG